jgi:predicted DNA-binding protein
MTVTIDMNSANTKLLENFAHNNNLTTDELLNELTNDYIEDEIDMQVALDALAELKKDPTTYSFNEIAEELDRR